MATDDDNTIYGTNGYEFEHPIVKKDDATGAKVPATALVGITGWISATEGGAAIDPTLSTPMTERSAKPGTYFGRILGNNINAHLFPDPAVGTNYDGQYVWVVISDAAGEIQGSTKIKAKAKRKV